MSSWKEEKKEIGKLALALKGSTREEFPSDLANLEDYIYKTYLNNDGEKYPDGWRICTLRISPDGDQIHGDGDYEIKKEFINQRQWIKDLQSGMYINCVYCGHRYGPKDEVPSSMADVLKEHIENCPSHPMSQLKKELDNVTKIKLDRGDLLLKIGNELGMKYPLENKEEILEKIKKLMK